MKLAIFGASGATGRQLVEQALAMGHEVTAVVRSAANLPLSHPGLLVLEAALQDAAAMRRAVENQDVVISVLGTRRGGPSTICADGAKSILAAMQAAGTRRLVALSAYGASETRRASLFIRFVRSVIADKMRDKDQMERLVRHSGIDWTLVRPPALTRGKRTGVYRFGPDLRIGALSRISRSDVADFILRHAISDEQAGKTLAITY